MATRKFIWYFFNRPWQPENSSGISSTDQWINLLSLLSQWKPIWLGPETGGGSHRLQRVAKRIRGWGREQKKKNESGNITSICSIESILFGYRAAKHQTAGYSSFFMLYHCEALLPIDIELMPADDRNDAEPSDDCIQVMVQACDNLKPGATKNINTTRTSTMTSDMVLRYFYMAAYPSQPLLILCINLSKFHFM